MADTLPTPGTLMTAPLGTDEPKAVGDWSSQVMGTVTAAGLFAYEGATFKSLTAVARHITGAHWSGPLFFGLTGQGRQGGAR